MRSFKYIDQPPQNESIREQWKRRVRKTRGDIYVRAIGIPYHVEVEPERDPSRIDHVWLTMEVPPVGRLTVAINTLSLINLSAGFDPRIRMGIVTSTFKEKPAPLLQDHAPLDYTVLESMHEINFEPYEPERIEDLLIRKCNAAVRAEVWGDLYIREHLGIHQVHSRRASCALGRDFIGRDGGMRLYYRDGVAELLLFKFCGQ